jgi:RimJ/RimL family protein N-acetyltransferase
MGNQKTGTNFGIAPRVTDPALIEVPESFETERLTIRAPRPGDGHLVLPAIIESLPELRKFPASLPWAIGEQTPESAELFCRTGYSSFIARKDLPYLLVERNSGLLAGCSGLHRINWSVPKIEIGYWCRTSMSGRGFITEAVRGLAAMALGKLGARRLEIITDEENVKSWRVCERCGFTLEGTLRNECRSPDGTLRNTRVYALLPS